MILLVIGMMHVCVVHNDDRNSNDFDWNLKQFDWAWVIWPFPFLNYVYGN